MFFWWFMFMCNMLYSVAMILGGWFMWKHCPEKINSAAGYRSKRSKLNRETWRFANENCGKCWWRIGWMMLLPTVQKNERMRMSAVKMQGERGTVNDGGACHAYAAITRNQTGDGHKPVPYGNTVHIFRPENVPNQSGVTPKIQ